MLKVQTMQYLNMQYSNAINHAISINHASSNTNLHFTWQEPWGFSLSKFIVNNNENTC